MVKSTKTAQIKGMSVLCTVGSLRVKKLFYLGLVDKEIVHIQ